MQLSAQLVPAVEHDDDDDTLFWALHIPFGLKTMDLETHVL